MGLMQTTTDSTIGVRRRKEWKGAMHAALANNNFMCKDWMTGKCSGTGMTSCAFFKQKYPKCNAIFNCPGDKETPMSKACCLTCKTAKYGSPTAVTGSGFSWNTSPCKDELKYCPFLTSTPEKKDRYCAISELKDKCKMSCTGCTPIEKVYGGNAKGVEYETEAEEWLTDTNIVRCIHGSPPLAWSEAMAKSAQEWADRGKYEHSASYSIPAPAGPAGENLAWGHRSRLDANRGWYSEWKDCETLPGCERGLDAQVGHFTAMIWKGAKEMGCGQAEVQGRMMYVCRYRAGDRKSGDTPNMGGYYNQNVPDRVKTEAECRAKVGKPAPLPDCDSKDDAGGEEYTDTSTGTKYASYCEYVKRTGKCSTKGVLECAGTCLCGKSGRDYAAETAQAIIDAAAFDMEAADASIAKQAAKDIASSGSASEPQSVELATGRPSAQSTQLAEGEVELMQSGSFGASSKAVDGNSNTDFAADSCTHTATQSNPWWRVDLQQRSVVNAVDVTNRGDCCGSRLSDFKILVGDYDDAKQMMAGGSQCGGKHSIPQGKSQVISCGLEGQFVMVTIPGVNKILSLCEVGVQGYPIIKTALEKANAEVDSKAAADKVAVDTAIADKAAADKVAADKGAAEQAIADQAAADKAAADKKIADKAAADKVAFDQLPADPSWCKYNECNCQTYTKSKCPRTCAPQKKDYSCCASKHYTQCGHKGQPTGFLYNACPQLCSADTICTACARFRTYGCQAECDVARRAEAKANGIPTPRPTSKPTVHGYMPKECSSPWKNSDGEPTTGLSACMGKCKDLNLNSASPSSNMRKCTLVCTRLCYKRKMPENIAKLGYGKDAFLTATNWWRCMYGAPALKWSEDLATSAKAWAATQMKAGTFKHYTGMYEVTAGTATNKGPFGENLAKGDFVHPVGVINTWANEAKNCGPLPGCRHGAKGVVGHFTAMIWKAWS